MTDDGIFLHNSWYVAAWNHELIDGKKLARTILERPIGARAGKSLRSMTAVATAQLRFRWGGSKVTTSGACITA